MTYTPFINVFIPSYYFAFNGPDAPYAYYFKGIITNTGSNPNPKTLTVNCYDKDGDGYYWWGIGAKPDTCPVCPDEEDCDDSNPNLGPYDPDTYECTRICEFSENEEHIDEDEVWNNEKFFNRNLVIEEGVTLTINDTVRFSEGARLIVKQGAKLLIDGGVLTSGCSGLWKGVEVWGNADTIQDTVNQGFVQVIHGGTIENAVTGILLCKNVVLDSAEVPNLNYTGGLVYAKEAVFRNNVTGVKFLSYQEDNNSYFSECRFVNDIYPLMSEESPYYFLWMDEVSGIDISGCSFNNDTEEEWNGRGIFSYNAYYKVHQHCPSQGDCVPCEFSGLEYGVYALGMNSTRYMDINKCRFENNYRGIFTANTDLAVITENRFEVPVSADEDHYTYGLYLEECNGYHVEADTFYGLDGNEPLNIGIYISKWEEPYENLLYNNYFENLQFGIIATGENRDAVTKAGLEIRCNDFTNTVNDVVVQPQILNGQPYITNYTGIAKYQGSPDTIVSAPAGNTFSDESVVEFNYDNDHGGNDIVYYHHSTGSAKIVPDPKTGLITTQPVGVPYIKQSACPSHIEVPGNNSLSLKIQMETAKTGKDNTADSLEMLTDGGNTPSLNTEVATSTPDEAYEIRNTLIGESPFLSDTVMSTAIYKENVLTNAMIRDVLVENPQAAKSSSLMHAIDNRSDTMPQYMKDEILLGVSTVSAKEILDASLVNYIINEAKAWTELFRHFVDTTNLPSKNDSLIQLYYSNGRLWAFYSLVTLYHQSSDSNSLALLLDSIPLKFDLTPAQEVIHEKYEVLYQYLNIIGNDSLGIITLDSISLISFLDLAEYYAELPAMLARNVLISNGYISYEEPVQIPQQLFYSPRLFKPRDHADKVLLKVFPNPSKAYFTVEYNLKEVSTRTLLIISDTKGAKVKEIVILKQADQMIVPTLDFAPGIYFVSLVKGNKVISVSRISINH